MTEACFHCSLPIPAGETYIETIGGQPRQFCCQGCLGVASMIQGAGLDAFYRYRDTPSPKPEDLVSQYTLYDKPDIAREFVHRDAEGNAHIDLLLDNIHCAACVWLIEKVLSKHPALIKVSINSVTRHAQVVWRGDTPISQLMEQLDRIGYPSKPLSSVNQADDMVKAQRVDLMRIAIAGFAMMQVGMVAAALYLGADDQWLTLFRWVSLLVATPVVFFSAKPFFVAAWRSLKVGHLIMDVPVAIAIALAYAASVWATIAQTGEIYFDSIAMFTFFLLIGRYLEKRLRVRNVQVSSRLTSLLPLLVTKVVSDQREQVPRVAVEPGDILQIAVGDTIPCDGVLLEGQAQVTQAWLTGESEVVSKEPGSQLMAGSINVGPPLLMEVRATGRETRLSAIERLVNQSQTLKPSWQLLADRIARYFVAGVLITATLVFSVWYFIEPAHALWVTLSVLVVTCPCALSLATPAAVTASLNALQQRGVLIVKGHVLETLGKIKTIVFDKTGTLTNGFPRVANIHCLADVGEQDAYDIACALEQGSSHPIARAFETDVTLKVTQREQLTGQGVAGVIDGRNYRLGKPSFSGAQGIDSGVVLSRDGEPIAHFELAETLNEGAHELVSELRAMGYDLAMLSGDSHKAVMAVANELGISKATANASPEDKTAEIGRYQEQGAVLMVGDGINDAPVLALADISIAMSGASDLAKTRADCVLLSEDLLLVMTLLKQAEKARRLIAQNITWALSYNTLALPLAALGIVPPYLAAAGMSLSSLVVVFNSIRLYR